MASLTEQLESELGPEPGASARRAATTAAPGDGLFSRANSVDTIAVLDMLGIAHDSTLRGEMAECPGCHEEGALVGESGGLKCLHDRCAQSGVPGKPGFRTNTELVALVQKLDSLEAAKRICDRFGLDRPRPARSQATPEPPPDTDPGYVPQPPNEERDPGDDSEEIHEEQRTNNVVPFVAAERAKIPAAQRHGLLSMQALLGMVYDELKKDRPRKGVPTGNGQLDGAIGGFRHGNITVLGAKRSFGKTSFSINAADTAIAAIPVPYHVLLLAGEDSEMMYGKRWMARRANLNAMRIRDLEATNDERLLAAKAFAGAPTVPFFKRVAGMFVEDIVAMVRELRKETPIDLVIVDYLQCIRAKTRTQDRRNEVTHVTKQFVDVIREAGAAGLLLSQLKRTERSRPEIEDLKESGDIEDMADHVILGFKESQPKDADGREQPDKRKLILAKNKDGVDEIEDIELAFDIRTASFQSTKHVGPHDHFDEIMDETVERYP